MIINASGRTDIVAYYMDWFVNRWNEGYFDVRNPFNPKLVSRIFVSDVDMIVFCTKNPLPLLDTIHLFSVPIQLQVTITGYFKDMEPQVPDKREVIECVKKLSDYLGKENVCVLFPVFSRSQTVKDQAGRQENAQKQQRKIGRKLRIGTCPQGSQQRCQISLPGAAGAFPAWPRRN